MKETVLDLGTIYEGMSCEDFTTLMVAGLFYIPACVRQRMNQHERSCEYHQSTAFHQSALGGFVTPEIVQAARKIVQKYSEEEKCH